MALAPPQRQLPFSNTWYLLDYPELLMLAFGTEPPRSPVCVSATSPSDGVP
jgi:hypothetical protein